MSSQPNQRCAAVMEFGIELYTPFNCSASSSVVGVVAVAVAGTQLATHSLSFLSPKKSIKLLAT